MLSSSRHHEVLSTNVCVSCYNALGEKLKILNLHLSNHRGITSSNFETTTEINTPNRPVGRSVFLCPFRNLNF